MLNYIICNFCIIVYADFAYKSCFHDIFNKVKETNT